MRCVFLFHRWENCASKAQSQSRTQGGLQVRWSQQYCAALTCMHALTSSIIHSNQFLSGVFSVLPTLLDTGNKTAKTKEGLVLTKLRFCRADR
jgi:hypothetical protein